MAQFDLVFEGGGAKGSVFVGALLEFEQRGHSARRFLGTSAGAITATLIAAGYNSKEILDAVNEKLANGKPRFSSFMDIPARFADPVIKNSLTYAIFRKVDLPWVPEMVEDRIDDEIFEKLMLLDAYREIFSFVERGGLYSGMNFLRWIKEKLNKKNPSFGDATFSELYAETKNDLSLVASDTSGQQKLILNHRTAPDCPVSWAVRMSMSIPFVWQEVHWHEDWGTYRGKDITGHIIVDGGLLSNFPIHYLSSKDEDVREVMGDTDPDAVPNLGFLIDETLPVANSGNQGGNEGSDEDSSNGLLNNAKRLKTVARIMRLVDTMTNAHDNLAMEVHKKEVCRLPAKGYGTTEFDMDDNRLKALVDAGREAMKNYLDS
jgi:NTE family protein